MGKKIEIDQSVKIEQSAQDTILAMANDLTRAIIIPANVKRIALNDMRRQGKNQRTAYYKLFAAGLFLLLKPRLQTICQQDEIIVIDTEYVGKEAAIKGMLLRYIQQQGISIPKNHIYFAQVGKSSSAHIVGWQVQRKLRNADEVISLEEIRTLL